MIRMCPLNIVITADPYIPVPPTTYGGIERVIDFLVRGLLARGHRVTLIAHPESRTDAELVPYGCPPHANRSARLRELLQVSGALLKRRKQLDVVHSFGRLAALVPLLPKRRIAKLQSYQRDGIPWRSVQHAVRLAGDSIRFTACAAHMFEKPGERSTRHGHWHAIFNGVDLSHFDFVPSVAPDSPLVFLGRIEPIKGTHNAIALARATGRRLVIAGNRVESEQGRRYFDEQVEPFLDGDRVQYVGAVNDKQKNELLGSAAALLMLIEWDEPFGIVMAEAMACGTPIVGLARGSVPEVVKNGVNGFVAANLAEAERSIDRLAAISRHDVRKACEHRFSNRTIVDQYEAIYRELCKR